MISLWVFILCVVIIFAGWIWFVRYANSQYDKTVAKYKETVGIYSDEICKLNKTVSDMDEKIRNLQNESELDKIAVDGMSEKCDELTAANEKLNDSIDNLLNENHQLHTAVYRPRKCPFCGGDVEFSAGRCSAKNVLVKHKAFNKMCPLSDGFTMSAASKWDAVGKWNARVGG